MKTHTLKSPFAAGALALGLGLAGTGAVFAAVSIGETLGTSEDQIRSALTAQGYTVEEIENEHGMLEADASLDGQRLEVVVDGKTGQVVKLSTETEDESDEKDDD